MFDERLKQLADQLVGYSVDLKRGEHLLINCTAAERPLVKELIRSTYEAGGYPHVQISDEQLRREIISRFSTEHAENMVIYEKAKMDGMDALISLVTMENPMEYAKVPHEKMALWNQAASCWNEKQRNGAVKWCVCIYPTAFYANCAGMSLDDFEEYYFHVCCMDYRRLGEAMTRLKEILDRTEHIHIKAPGTDLEFSIKGIPKRISAGDRNIPDGEVYTAPVRESVNGVITFNVPSIFSGKRFENIRLVFRDGKAVEAYGAPIGALNEILNTDSGARYIGEFAFGLNPALTVPIGLTLFDEKINGSFHLAMGNALDVTDNGNRSAIHWDMVSMQTPEMGGGSIYADGTLLRKDGKFVLPQLEELNSR